MLQSLIDVMVGVYMNKRLFNILAIIVILLTVIVAVKATPKPIINSVTILNPDNFYSNYSGNNIINISVNVTGIFINGGDSGNTSANITANFTSVSTNCAGTTALNNIVSIGSGIYNFSCNLTNDFGSVANFSVGAIVVSAWNLNLTDALGPNGTTSTAAIVLYNITTPPDMPAASCMKWGSRTTNFSQVSNFAAVNFVLDVQGNLSCLSTLSGGGAINSPSYQNVMLLNLTSVDLSTYAKAIQLASLQSAINITIVPPRSFGSSRIYINSSAFSALNTTANITLLNLPFTTMPSVLGDIPSELNGTSVSWATNVYNATFGAITGNLTFNVFGFSGYNISDNAPPTFSNVMPNASIYINTTGSMLVLNFTPLDIVSMSACWYTLIGQINVTTNISVANVSVPCSNGTAATQQLYLANGTYNITIYANDNFNNTGSTNVLFNVSDIAAPTINITSPIATAYAIGTTSVNINVTTDENATCTWGLSTDFTPFFYTFNDSATSHTTIKTGLSDGSSYTINISCVDMSGNIATTQNVNFNVSAAASSSPSGSSSSGSSSSGSTVLSSDPSESTSFDLIPAGSKVVSIDRTGIPVSEIFITTLAASTNVKFVVTSVSSPSSTYTANTVYKYIQVDHAALSNDIIDDARIKFAVAKSWLTSNNKDKTSIALLRYTTQWDVLTTTITSEDNTYVYYLADSPGLSLFAISTKPAAITAPNTTIINTTKIAAPTDITANATENNSKASTLANVPYDWTWVIIVVALLIIILLFVTLGRKHHRKKQEAMK